MEAFKDLSDSTVLTTVVIAALLLGTFIFIRKSRISSRNGSLIPRVPSYLPYIGSGIDYFQSVVLFDVRNQKQYGNAFYATIFGHNWLFIHSKDDIAKMMRSNERQVSMYQALGLIAGKLLPNDSADGFHTHKVEQLVSRGKNWDGPSATPIFVQALKPQRLRAWIPEIQSMLVQDLSELSDCGQVELFQWCNDLISAITARVLFGKDLAKDKELSTQWIELVRKAEPEKAFSDPLGSIGALVEISLLGERRDYVRAREFIYPFIDAEINKCINNEPEGEEASVLSGLVRNWFKLKLEQNADYLKEARIRIANDLFLFTFAAITNSYAGAAWVIWHVLRNTDGVGDRVQEELKRLGPDADSLPEMEMLIYEIGRLYAPGSLFRLLLKDFTLPSTGDIIPSGTLIAFNVAGAHRNADAFTNPLDFDPKRFDNDRDEQKTAGGLFLPFGSGAHPCVGRRFAIMEIALFVAMALDQFDWELVDDDDNRRQDPFTQSLISNMPNHPKLDKAQNNSIWRPVEPVMVQYKRKITPS